MGYVTVDHGRHRQGARPTRRWTVFLMLAVALVGVASIVWSATASDRRGAAAPVAGATLDADAAEWIRSNFTGDVRLLADGHAAPQGYDDAPIDQPDQDWHDFDYLLTDPGTDPPPDASVAAVWQSSVPVAIFPTVQVRRILQTPLSEILRSQEADRADRLMAGLALLGNPRVVASGPVQASLAAGGLDLRPAATLTALAGAATVEVVNVEDVRAEAAAGMPARSMTIHVADASKATTVISGMTSAFRPEQVTGTPDGTFRLHWPLRFAPLPSVN